MSVMANYSGYEHAAWLQRHLFSDIILMLTYKARQILGAHGKSSSLYTPRILFSL